MHALANKIVSNSIYKAEEFELENYIMQSLKTWNPDNITRVSVINKKQDREYQKFSNFSMLSNVDIFNWVCGMIVLGMIIW